MFTLYMYGDEPVKHTKVRGNAPKDEDEKYERHKSSQRKYYKERGAFLSYLRKLERKLEMDVHELKHINTIKELDEWCRLLILERLDINITEKSAESMYKYFYDACKKKKPNNNVEFWKQIRANNRAMK